MDRERERERERERTDGEGEREQMGREREKISCCFVGGMGSLQKILPPSQARCAEACSYCVHCLYLVSSGISVSTMSSPICSIKKR